MNFTDSIDQIKQRYQVEDSTNINTTQKTTQSELTLTINWYWFHLYFFDPLNFSNYWIVVFKTSI